MREMPQINNLSEGQSSNHPNVSRILDQLPIGVFVGTGEGELEYLNRFLIELLRANENDEVWGVDSLESQISDKAKHCRLTGEQLAARIVVPKGADLRIRIFPDKDKTGQIVGVVGLVEDVASAICSQAILEKKIGELSLLCELGKVLRSTLNVDDTLGIVLTMVTAGQGLGFNRAFLLLVNDDGTALEGKMAVGPSSPEEARCIWASLSNKEQSLEEVLRSCRSTRKGGDEAVNLIVKRMKIPLSAEENPLIRSMLEKKTFVVSRGQVKSDHNLFNILQTDKFATAPLISEDKILGVVIADNLINGKPIGEDDVKLLSICADHASVAIEKSRLYQELKLKVNRLAEANKRIAESSRRLLKVEKLSILGQITSQLAHELRNPMTIIGGFAHSILRKMEKDNPDSEYLKIMVKETERMENVLNNVLNFSKPDSANLEMVSLNELVNQTFEMMEPEIDAGRISISVFPQDGLPLIRANSDLIRQALLNIFRNAIWAMPNGGMLSVTTITKDKRVRVEVKDTGMGICREHMRKVFEAFFTTNSEACGLGLTIASEIIKNHGGDIGVESRKGMGSTFYIELPLTEDRR